MSIECMTGVVTESSAPVRGSLRGLESLLPEYSPRGFVSYSNLMDDLGVPKSGYECSKIRLRNGKTVYYSDPQLGWGDQGFGYYITTFIEPVEDR